MEILLNRAWFKKQQPATKQQTYSHLTSWKKKVNHAKRLLKPANPPRRNRKITNQKVENYQEDQPRASFGCYKPPRSTSSLSRLGFAVKVAVLCPGIFRSYPHFRRPQQRRKGIAERKGGGGWWGGFWGSCCGVVLSWVVPSHILFKSK